MIRVIVRPKYSGIAIETAPRISKISPHKIAIIRIRNFLYLTVLVLLIITRQAMDITMKKTEATSYEIL